MNPIPVPRPPKHTSPIGMYVVISVTVGIVVLFVLAVSAIGYFILSQVDNLSDRESPSTQHSEKTTDELTHDIAVQLTESKEGTFALHNNFTYLFNLSQNQEARLGVATIDSDATRVTTVRGIPLYETPCRPFRDREISQLALFLNRLPQEVLEMRPKGIVSSCIHDLNIQVDPLTNALTSGPYIYVGNEFFDGTLFSGTFSENEKVSIFAHEYGHVLQYYYVHQFWLQNKRTDAYEYDNSSTVVYDFARSVGYIQEKTADDYSFFNPAYTWKLSDTPDARLTTKYALENGPTEDFAESFGIVVAGQPQTISKTRSDYILQFLHTDEETFIRGVVPQYPTGVRITFDYLNYLESRIRELPVAGKEIVDENQWGVNKSVPFETIVSYYESEMARRSFEPVEKMANHPGEFGDQFAAGVYIYQGKTYVILVMGTITTSVTTVATGPNSSITQRRTLTPELYNITVLRYE